jgi:hypothetical protein
MNISYSKPGMRLAIQNNHFVKVMKELYTSQININHPRYFDEPPFSNLNSTQNALKPVNSASYPAP